MATQTVEGSFRARPKRTSAGGLSFFSERSRRANCILGFSKEKVNLFFKKICLGTFDFFDPGAIPCDTC